MNFKKALGMVLLLIVGLAVVWQQGLLGTIDSIGTKGKLLIPGYESRDVIYLSFISEKGEVAVDRLTGVGTTVEGSEWTMLSPIGAPVDSVAVVEAIRVLGRLRVEHVVSGVDQAEAEKNYGFSPPALRVTVNLAGTEHQVDFGKKNELSGRRYVMLKNHPEVYIIPEAQYTLIYRKPFDLMDRTPVKFPADQVQEILVRGKLTLPRRFVRKVNSNGDSWIIYGEGRSIVADSEMVESLLQDLSAMRMEGLLLLPNEMLHLVGMRPPALAAEIRFLEESQEPITILFSEAFDVGNSVKARAKKGEDIVQERRFYFKTPESEWTGRIARPMHLHLARDIGDYRQKELLASLSIEYVSSLELRRDGQSQFTLSSNNENEQWVLNPGGHNVDVGQVIRWLSELNGFRVQAFLNGVKPSGLDSPSIELRAVTKSGELAFSLEIGAPIAEIPFNENKLRGGSENKPKPSQAPRFGRFLQGNGISVLFSVAADQLVGFDVELKRFISSTESHR